MDTTSDPTNDPPMMPQDFPPDEGALSHKIDRPAQTAIPSPTSDVLRYRPGVAAVAAFILITCIASSVVRWADDRFFPDRPVSRVVCRGPDGGVEILPRGVTVGEALEAWEVDTAGIADKILESRVPDGSRITIVGTRAGRRVVIGELPASERYALGLDFDINRATVPDLALIPGIGEASAKKIVAYRKTRGDFLSERDLSVVPDLDKNKVRAITRHVSFGPAIGGGPRSEDVASVDAPGRGGTPGPSDKLTEGDPPIDINRATAADLMRIPGVGEVTADRIIDCRDKNGPFRAVADLERVGGIGKKKAEKIGGYVTF